MAANCGSIHPSTAGAARQLRVSPPACTAISKSSPSVAQPLSPSRGPRSQRDPLIGLISSSRVPYYAFGLIWFRTIYFD
jgi:hypothetical protein